jgi:hypothetical protein
MTDQNNDAFFEVAYDDDEVPERIPRDQWKRPLIMHPETGELTAYTRASSLSNFISNKGGLHRWDVRQIVFGMGRREDLGWMAGALPRLKDDKRLDAPTNARLDEIAEEARISAGANLKANWGSAVHGYTEPGMEGVEGIPKAMQPDVDSYWTRLREYGLTPIASEIFVVNDKLQCAGTFDDLYWSWAHGIIVGDKKSGKQNIHDILVQLAVYVDGEVYDERTGERFPLTSLLPDWLASAAGQDDDLLNTSQALYVHIPKEKGVTEFYEVDIDLGREAAAHAAWVGKYQKRKDLVVSAHDSLTAGVAQARHDAEQHLLTAESREECVQIAKDYQSVWTPELTAIGKARIAEISAPKA